MKNSVFIFFDIFLVCILLILMYGNFRLSAVMTDYVIELLNFIALEWFDKERFYIYARGVGTGLYFFGAIIVGLFAMSLYSILCYWLYSKYQGLKYFLIIFAIFAVYFCLLCLFFRAYRFSSFLLHFIPFCLMYIEIILLYRIKSKIR